MLAWQSLFQSFWSLSSSEFPGILTLNRFRSSRCLRNSTAQKLGSAQTWAYGAPWSDLMAPRCPRRDEGTAGKEWNAERHWLAGPCTAPQCSLAALGGQQGGWALNLTPWQREKKQRSSPRDCSPGACSSPCQAAVPALAFTRSWAKLSP